MLDSSVKEILKTVRSALSDKDISEKKGKNPAGLNINLLKFTGYYFDIDR